MTFSERKAYACVKQLLTLLFILCAVSSRAQPEYVYDSLTHTEVWRFSNGNIETVCKWYDVGRIHDHRTTHYSNKGLKTAEFSQRNGMFYDTARYWRDDGSLELMEIYSDSGYVSISYHDTTGFMQERKEYRIPNKIRSFVHLNDTINNVEYYSQPVEYGSYEPAGTWSTFHANGQLESTGSYLPLIFESHDRGYDTSKQDRGCYPAGTIIMYDIVNDAAVLKDGTWHYYDENGKKVREEFYEGGILRNTIEFH